ELVHALLLGRIIALHEYNNALAQVRLDDLPELRPEHSGWKLLPAERLKTHEPAYKRMNKERLELLRDIAAKHGGTPWAFVADRERDEKMGLEWAGAAAK